MQLSKTLSLLAAATVALAQNQLTFISQDDLHRTVYFTPSDGYEWLKPVRVEGWRQVSTSVPQGWIGNYYSITDGKHNKPGMLGEVTFQGWEGKTYFDVSAIVDDGDHNGVKVMYPAVAKEPTSGCERYPCGNAYYQPNDKQTKVTQESHIVTTLGGTSYDFDSDSDSDSDWDSDSDSDGEYEKRSVEESYPREAVLGLWPQI